MRVGAVVAVVVGALVVVSGGDGAAGSHCTVDHRPPLSRDIAHSIAWIKKQSRAVVRRDARNRQSPLGKVLGGSSYSIHETGYISNGGPSRYHRTFRVIGGLVDLRIQQPHPVDAVVPAWSSPWPRRSKNYKYSRHYGYVPYRAHFVSSRPVVDLMIDVDMRVRRVIGIEGGVESGEDLYEPLPGHCPLRPPSGD
jgi:hypothetical protein